MPLAKSTPSTQAPIVPSDIQELPRLPEGIRQLDPEGVDEYQQELSNYWSRLIDTINAIANRIGT